MRGHFPPTNSGVVKNLIGILQKEIILANKKKKKNLELKDV